MLRLVSLKDAVADELPGGLCIQLHAAGASALCADLRLLAEAAQGSLQVRQFLLDFVDSGAQLVRVDSEVFVASPAGELGVQFELADGLRDLVAAVRAGEVDRFFVQQSSHGHPSRKVVDCEK